MPDPGVMTLMDVLDEVGDDTARACFWAFGDWSDLWREAKPVPPGVDLAGVMRGADDVGQLRWTRCALELSRAACGMCPASMASASLEMLAKLSRCGAAQSA